MLEALGQYKINGPIGIGRMGELYRARDTRAGRTVAIGVVADDIAGDPARCETYLEDARATLSHPNIAVVYETGTDQGRLFVVSEDVPGDTLDAIVLRMFAKSLDQRCESAAAVAAELRSVAAILDVRDGSAEPVTVAASFHRPRVAGRWIMFAVLAASILAAALMTTDLGQRWWSTLARTWQQNSVLVLRSW